MTALLLLLTLLLSLNAWLLEPLVQGITGVLELPLLPWLFLAVGAWVLAGNQRSEKNPRPRPGVGVVPPGAVGDPKPDQPNLPEVEAIKKAA